MTIAIALRCKDGIVVATDGKVTRASTAYRAIARIWQRADKAHVIAPHAVVTGAGELAMLRAVAERLRSLPESERARGLDALVPAARETLVAERTAGLARYAKMHGPEAARELAPRAFVLLCEATPKPRIVYLSEDGDVEDQTHLGYAVVGSGDLTSHVRLQSWDTATLTTEQGAVLAFGLVKDTIESGTFYVSDPVRIWTLAPRPEAWDEARLTKLAETFHAYRAKIHDLLRSL